MAPKRKRGTDDTTGTTATRSTRSTARNKASEDGMSVADSSVAETGTAPSAKKVRKTTSKTSQGGASTARGAQQRSDEPAASTSVTKTSIGAFVPQTADDGTSKPPKPSSEVNSRRSSDSGLYTPARATELFSMYTDSDDPNTIGPTGFERLCNDAEIPLDGALPLLLAWQLGASEMANITKDEWERGMQELHISSLSPLDVALHDLEALLLLDKLPLKPPAAVQKKKADPYNRARYYKYAANPKKSFHEFYLFCFLLAKPPQARNIDMETATAFWSVLLLPRYPLMQDILDFIQEKGTYKGVNKDLWLMILEFCRSISPSLQGYEADGAWPTMLDDFVTWKRGKMPPANGAAPANGNGE